MNDVDNGEGDACVRAEGIWEISVHPFQLCCKLKLALKDKVFLKRPISTYAYPFFLINLKGSTSLIDSGVYKVKLNRNQDER